jgi:glycosyltransferase involved in cell wall biosynthesis
MNKDEPIKILRLIARLNIGGPAIQAIALSSARLGQQYETLLVCGCLNPGEGDMSYLAVEQGVQPCEIKTIQRKISFIGDLKSLWMIRKVIKCFQPQIIHTHTAKAGTLGRVAALTIGIPFLSSRKYWLVHTFHGHTFHSYFNKLKTLLFIQIERLLAGFTDKIIVISKKQKDDICHRYKIADEKKVRIIKLGFDLSKFDEIRIKPHNFEENNDDCNDLRPFKVGLVGRLTAVKNPSMLLQTAHLLRNMGKINCFRFDVIGDGELKDHMTTAAEKLDVRNFIVFKGWQKDMATVYSELDAVVLTSKNEGTPVAIIEAMASSRPVVVSAVGGVPDLIGNIIEKKPDGFQIAERGLSVPSGDAKALAAALLFIKTNLCGLEPMVRRAKEFVFADYSQQRLLNDIRTLYETIHQ